MGLVGGIQYKTAFELFSQALYIDKQVFHEYHPNLGLDYDDIGDVYFQEKEFFKARENYERSRMIFSKNYGEDFEHVKLLDEKIALTNTN